MIRRNTLLAGLTVALGLGACGDGGADLARSAELLQQYYVDTPLGRSWRVETIAASHKENTLRVNVQVTDEADVQYLKALSSMDRLHAAKLACPKPDDALRVALGSKTRIWVHLNSKTQEIISSVCPK
ncbi:MAG: hypothetical protein HQL36_12785 [Alphaproteobacteria bacterium]|nr:hypothetical protein [Alphaproteobacteria bacterium]